MTKYYVLYKPFMVMCQFSPILGKTTLADLDLKIEKDMYAVGRLDEDSEGFLLLTNDKSLNNALLHPKNKHSRTYFAQIEGNITSLALEKLEKGVQISLKEGICITLPCKAKIIDEPIFLPIRNPPIRYRAHIPTSWIELHLIEGKNRQVRKMTASVGFPTLRLVRYSMGNYNIENFKSGEIKQITLKELQLNIT